MLLSIETSCDETAVALYSGGTLHWEEVFSQIPFHEKYGGVVPELASREHLKALPVLYDNLPHKDSISAVAAAIGPGLKGCLLVGSMFGQGLAKGFSVPFVPVNHIEGHLYSGLIEGPEDYSYPLLGMIVSGGHSEIILAKEFGDYERVCFTRDDAAGEAFDKVGKLLGLGYPGGPAVSKFALGGNSERYEIPIGMASEDDAFSFSGVKTWISQLVNKNLLFSEQDKADLCASFEQCVSDTLCLKLERAIQKYKPESIVLAGGVACNRVLREAVRKLHSCVIIPSPKYCTDNAAMIAVVGAKSLAAGRITDFKVRPRWPL